VGTFHIYIYIYEGSNAKEICSPVRCISQWNWNFCCFIYVLKYDWMTGAISMLCKDMVMASFATWLDINGTRVVTKLKLPN
jgi:hypothetical protein